MDGMWKFQGRKNKRQHFQMQEKQPEQDDDEEKGIIIRSWNPSLVVQGFIIMGWIFMFVMIASKEVEAVGSYDCEKGKHQYSVTIKKNSTIDEAGIRLYACELCEERYEEEIPKLGHNYGEWIIETEADCVQEGLRYRVCDDDIHEDEVREEEVLPAGEHNFVEDSQKSKAATCEAGGRRVSVCAGCNQKQEVSVSATGHDYGEWEIRKNATVFSDGLRIRVCSNESTHIEEEVLEKGIQNLTTMDQVMVAANTTNFMVFFLLIRYDYAVILWNRRKLRKLLIRGLKTK